MKKYRVWEMNDGQSRSVPETVQADGFEIQSGVLSFWSAGEVFCAWAPGSWHSMREVVDEV